MVKHLVRDEETYDQLLGRGWEGLVLKYLHLGVHFVAPRGMRKSCVVLRAAGGGGAAGWDSGTGGGLLINTTHPQVSAHVEDQSN